MPNNNYKNYKPKKVAHRTLARRTTELNSLVDEANEALETVTNRERVLADGESEQRADMARTYPALTKEH